MMIYYINNALEKWSEKSEIDVVIFLHNFIRESWLQMRREYAVYKLCALTTRSKGRRCRGAPGRGR